GAVGGEGGGGGERVEGWFLASELPDAVDFRVGRGGLAGVGQDGQDGEDSAFGEFVVGKRGRGGRGGRVGQPKTRRDSSGDVVVTSALFANAIELRDGLAFILGGGWARYPVQAFPTTLSGHFLAVFHCTAGDVSGERTFEFELMDVNGAVLTQCL